MLFRSTAIRLGAKEVKVVCLESREEMPADEIEIEEAEREGIEMFPAHSLVEMMVAENKVNGIKCNKINFKGFDDEGRPDFETIEGSEHEFIADAVIFSIGQVPEISFADEGIEVSRFGTIVADEDTLATAKSGVFAGGDVISGTKFVIDAVAAGQVAARSIDRYLRGEELKQDEPKTHKVELSDDEIAQRLKSRGEVAATKKVGEVFHHKHDQSESGLTEEEAMSEAERCLSCAICSECFQCVEVCGPEAIDHNMPSESIINLKVGAVILTTGCEVYDPDLKKEFGFQRYQNVISSLQFERILSASGPFKGEVLRLSDRQKPKKMAFIQCVGSRDTENQYCSSICCMAAVKEAIIAKEHDQDLECTIFYIDIRAFSKGYEDYYNRAKELGVKFVRCRPSAIKEVPGTKDLRIKYQTSQNEIEEDIFNLVEIGRAHV